MDIANTNSCLGDLPSESGWQGSWERLMMLRERSVDHLREVSEGQGMEMVNA